MRETSLFVNRLIPTTQVKPTVKLLYDGKTKTFHHIIKNLKDFQLFKLVIEELKDKQNFYTEPALKYLTSKHTRIPLYHLKNSNSLHILFLLKDVKSIKLLINRLKVDPKTIFDNFGSNLLFYPISEECLKLYLNLGVDINKEDDDGRTALFFKSKECEINLFLKYGANMKHKDKFNKTHYDYYKKAHTNELNF